MVKVVSIDAPEPKKMRRIGFGDGTSKIPDDFDTMLQKEIEEMFYGKRRDEAAARYSPFALGL